MTNPYYNHSSGVPATLTRAASSQIRNEFDLIEDGLDAVETAVDTKAAHAGQVYTGTHDFSGATDVTLPAATSIGNVSATEIAFLDGVTSGVQGQIDSEIAARIAVVADLESRKADTSGETYSGAHDFTGATISVASPSSGSSATTKTYVDDQINFSLSGGILWVSGTTYPSGFLVYSPINFLTYRCSVGLTSTIDPSIDNTHWVSIGGSGGGSDLANFYIGII